MLSFKEVVYVSPIKNNNNVVLAGDIGGTNSNFGVCDISSGKVRLVLSLHLKSKEIKDFAQVVNQLLNYLWSKYQIKINKACIGSAGVISANRDFCKPTNLSFAIDAQKIIQVTALHTVILINDFEAVGYGIDWIAKKDLIEIKKGKQREYANRAIIGAGTGLGKNILGWDYSLKGYIPIPSEGGHADFSAYSNEEFEYLVYLKNMIRDSYPISWEDVLSGGGIVHLYNFLGLKHSYQKSKIAGMIKMNGIGPEIIFGHCQQDKQCADTYKLYAGYYGRCAKNFALESLSLGGLYIAGGIAAKNVSLFYQPEFLQEFMNNREMSMILQDIRICVVKDYNVSLFGAGGFLATKEKNLG
jgi:glucokinase